jgi:type I restriction enzyme S subunit
LRLGVFARELFLDNGMSEQNELPQLPKGWVWTRLENFTDIILGQSPPSSTYNESGKGFPFYQGKAEFGKIYPIPQKWCTAPTKFSEKGDVLISVRAPVGPTNICPEYSAIGRGLAAIRGLGGIQPLLVLYLIRAFENQIAEQGTGSTFSAITGNQLKNFQFPLAPLPEQQRIVAKIEELFSDLDAGVAALQKTKTELKRYRQAVLKAAVEGKLTAEWRAANAGKVESAERLLERIRVGSRQDAKAQSKKALPRVDASELPALPEGWCWASLESLAANEPHSITDGPFGSNLKTEHYTDSGPRVIRLQNIGDGAFFDAKAHISPEHFDKLSKHQIFADDLVIAGLGETLPRACTIPEYVGSAIVKADCIRFKSNPIVTSSRYLNIALNSDTLKKIAMEIVHGVGRPRLNQQQIKALPIPLPPLAEQQQIVAEVERRLSVAEQVERTMDASLKQAERLRQSILRQAFAGKLVPQDPGDEPAERLLERIGAERAKQASKLKTPKFQR